MGVCQGHPDTPAYSKSMANSVRSELPPERMSSEINVKWARPPQWNWLHAHPNLAMVVILAAAFVVRARAAAGTFLNADEVLHFSIANQRSLLDAYKASWLISHPPLLPLLLYFWRGLGDSDFVLRLLSVLLGTGFCWVFFKWLARVFGETVAWSGLIFAAFLPPLIALSAEVRQYALLLFFCGLALYFLERALQENSVASMAASVLFLYLALLSHYSAALFAATIGIYGGFRMARERSRFSRGVIALWLMGQAAGLGLCVALYLTSVKTLGTFFQGQPLHAWMGDSYLHNSYFAPERQHALGFTVSRTGSVFQYLFGQDVIGDLAFVGFVAALVMLARNKQLPDEFPANRRLLALLLALPFVLNCAVAFAGIYPYGGTRHCVFLAIFAVAGVSVFLARAVRQRVGRAVMLTIVIVLLCQLFLTHRLPYIARADQSSVHMREAVSFIQNEVPSSDVILVDNQTSLLVAHYLCRPQVFAVYAAMRDLNRFECGGHTVIATNGEIFAFTADNFPRGWNQMVRAYDLRQGNAVWVLQEGWLWGESLAHQLEQEPSRFGDLKAQCFGHNITIFRLAVPNGGSL
jgi:uncharacterized membrane protein